MTHGKNDSEPEHFGRLYCQNNCQSVFCGVLLEDKARLDGR